MKKQIIFLVALGLCLMGSCASSHKITKTKKRGVNMDWVWVGDYIIKFK